MTKRSLRLEHAAHIKRNTEGTSNEISLDVLDATSSALDEGKRTFKLPSPARIIKSVPHVSLSSFGAQARRSAGKDASKESLSIAGEGAPPCSTAKGTSSTAASRPFVNSRENSAFSTASRAEGAAPRRFWPFGTASNDRRAADPAYPGRVSYAADADAEIRRRKTRRQLHRCLRALLVLALVGVLAVVGVQSWRSYESHNGRIEELATTLDSITRADEQLAELDEILAAPLDRVDSEDWTLLDGALTESARDLAQARDRLGALANELGPGADADAARTAQQAIDERITLMEEARGIMRMASDARAAESSLIEAWTAVSDADALARDAASAAAEAASAEDAEATMEANRAAIARFNDALSLFAQLENSEANLDLSAYRAYVEKRIEAMGYAMEADEAAAARDKETAQERNDAYNAADAEAVELARALPFDLSDPIEKAFAVNSQPLFERYRAQLEQVGETDKILQDYLGEQNK